MKQKRINVVITTVLAAAAVSLLFVSFWQRYDCQIYINI